DAFRSFIFITIAFVALLLYFKGKLKNQILVICIIGLCSVIDLWGVAKRYVNNDLSYQTQMEALPSQSQAETMLYNEIQAKKPAHYRVYNMAVNTFNETNTSYFFPSIGGYHAAKLQRYQDIIDFYFTNTSYKQNDIQDTALLAKNQLRQVYYQASQMPNFPMPNMGVLNMLDTRYVIINQQAFIENTEACGAAWFVNNIKWVNNADEEILALDNFNPKQTIIIDKQFSDVVKANEIKADTTSKVVFVNDDVDNPEKRVYKVSTKTPQLLVFSEIYYKDSWHCYLDGKEVPYFRANYVLRAMNVPAGEHTVEFVCQSSTIKTGGIINLIGSVLLVLLLVGALASPYLKKKFCSKEKIQ
ncbi:MAG: hypothetical protein HUK18_05085, partial [Bacteroidales bacterium]|nr:hypothetical protein [Bacteroidales bacterium]